MNNEIIDIFDVLSDDLQQPNIVSVKLPVDEALLACLDSFGCVDVMYISECSGLSVKQGVDELHGTIFQDPEQFLLGKKYDIASEWVLSSKYLSGNVRKKLSEAEKANKKFPGVFSSNIEKLKAVMPEDVQIDDIHIALGALWIPVHEVARFIKHFLNLNATPDVYFYEDLLTYKIVPLNDPKESVLNTITYGVRGEIAEYGSTYVKQYLTAIEIIEQTMNAKTIKVYDYIPKGGWSVYEYEPVLNQAKTVEAQNKQKAIIDAFRDYVYSDRARTVRFEQYYNDKLVGYTYSQYDGSFLKFSDLNPEISLYKHQRDAIARVLLSGGNLLLAHDVGTGKTYEMIVSVHELYRMGISKKKLVVVPNNVLKATVDAHKHLYADDKILAIYPKDFTPENRNHMLELIRDDDYVAIYMHCVLKHCTRGRGKLHLLYNIACDIVVNSVLLEALGISNMKIGDGTAMHLTPKCKEGRLYSAEEVYEMLLKEADEDFSAKYGVSLFDSHDIWEKIASDPLLEEVWDKYTKDAAKGAGKGSGIPEALSRMVEAVEHKPKIA